MKNDHDPRHLNLDTFCRSQERLAGQVSLRILTRLFAEAVDFEGDVLVRYAANGSIRADGGAGQQQWVQLSAEFYLPMTCQRCLSPVDVLITFDREFRFVTTEEQAAQEDEVSEEDVLVASRDFNLLDLIEDELLMALPPVPTHEVCPQTVKLQVADPDFEEQPAEKPNPFAVLEQLKKKPLA